MRVAILATSVGNDGGVQRYGTALIEALAQEGHTFSVWESIRWKDRLAQINGVSKFATSLRHHDLVWILHPRLALIGIAAARLSRLPAVVSTYGFENWGAYSLASRFALTHATTITAISMFSSSMMGEPGRRAILLRPTWGVCGVQDTSAIDRRLVLFVGRLNEKYKGADVALELAARFKADHRWTFVLAGDGRLSVPSQDLAGTLGNVAVVRSPSDEDLANLYAEAAVLIAPTRASRLPRNRWAGGEGFGIVLLEAAVSGVPVLASDEGACPETVALLGHGLIARPSANDFEPALRRLLDDPELRRQLGDRGKASAMNLSPDSFRDTVTEILRASRRSP